MALSLAGFLLPVHADTLSLDDVTEQAIQRSFAIKIAAMNIGIDTTREKIAPANYILTIKGNLNTGYLLCLIP